MLRILTTITLIFQGIALFAQTGPLYFPPKNSENWATEAPGDLGFCSDRIDSLYQFLGDRDTKSFILLHNGKIVLEKYFGTYTRDSLWYWASAGKSLTSFLVGQAKDEGLIHLEDKTSQYLGAGWTSCSPEKEDLITIWHQLTMTTGLDDSVLDDNCTDPSCLLYKADAGIRWAYYNASYRLLHDVIQSASGLTIQQFTKTRVLDKIGMKGFWIDHIEYGRARDMARFGLLTMANGIWNGDTLLHDQNYVTAMHTPSQTINKSYGYLWWLNGQQSFMLPTVQFVFPGEIITNAPSDMYAALGKNDQKIHIVPSKGWVVVRQGNPGTAEGALDVPIVFDNEMWGYINALTCAPSGVNTLTDNTLAITLSPTIAVDNWQISAPTPLEKVSIVNSAGQIVRSLSLPATTTVTVPAMDLPSGVYFLKCMDTEGRIGVVKGMK